MPDGPVKKSIVEAPSITQSEQPPERGAEAPTVSSAERPAVSERKPVAPAIPMSSVPVVPARTAKSPMLYQVENILEEDLVELYRQLTPEQRKQFKAEGERTARKIETLLKKAIVTVMEIIRLIRRWMRLLPGANVFFIEQEAKIKAERILALKKK